MPAVRDWIQASRLRTLPLAAACVMIGSAVGHHSASQDAVAFGRFWWVFAGTLATVLVLQILSNYANDLGDSLNGADDHTRQDRAVASGRISPRAMRFAVLAGALKALVLGMTTVAYALWGTGNLPAFTLLVGLGVLGIVAAYKYTAGKNPYGYQGLGDLMVFLFFGWIGVGGTAFLLSHTWSWTWLLPGTFSGALCVSVLNLNNLRDHEKDAAAGKLTWVTRMGFEGAKKYHLSLFVVAWGCFLIYFLGIEFGRWSGLIWMGLIALVHLRHLVEVWHQKNPAALDPELKKIALSTAVVALFLLMSAVNYPLP